MSRKLRCGLALLACGAAGAATLAAQAPTPQTPARPAASAPPPGQGPMPVLPLTELDERGGAADLDNRAFTLTFAQPVPVKDLLLLIVRGTSLSIVPDPAIDGTFLGELKNVTVRQALGLILPPLGLDFSTDGTVVRVFERVMETRLFELNYLAVRPAAEGGGRSAGGPAADVFADVSRSVQALLSEKAAVTVDRQAGLVQVTDFPERLDRVEAYLEAVHHRVDQQLRIDARVLEVELNEDHASGIDWTMLGQDPDSRAAGRPGLTGRRIVDVSRLLAALAEQGKVSVLASPTLLALNNEPALVRAATRRVAPKGNPREIADEFVLNVTSQIAPDGVIMLGLNPTVSRREAGDKDHEAMVRQEADTLVRVVSGETLVVAGFPRDRESFERRAVGVKGGWFGRATVVTKKRVELVVLLTPRVLGDERAP